MKSVVIAVCAATMGAAAVGEDVFVGFGETKKVDVPAESTQAGNIVVAPKGVVRKSGEGRWTVNSGNLFVNSSARFEVTEGALKVEPTSAPTQVKPDGVDEVLAIAADWFDSTKADSFVTDANGNITDWLDARETGAAGSYVYNRAQTDTQLFASDPLYPVVQTDDTYGQKGLYFHGVKSGCWMKFVKPDGGKWSCFAYNVFIVHGVKSGLGNVLGVRKSFTTKNLAFCAGNSSGETLYPLWCMSTYETPAIATARTYVNGDLYDGRRNSANGHFPAYPKGFTLLEVELLRLPGEVSCFYSDRGYAEKFPGRTKETLPSEFQWAGGVRVGGDYVSEAVFFTNRLTNVQRLTVERYLMNKWFGIRRPSSVAVDTAEGACVERGSRAAGDEDLRLTLSGNGTLVKDDADGTVESWSQLKGYLGSVALGEAADFLHLGDNGFRLESDRTYAATVSRKSRSVTSRAADAAAGKCFKTGADELRVETVATNVTRLYVNEGTLRLSAPVRPANVLRPESSRVRAVIPNPSFEIGTETNGRKFSNGDTFQGWHAEIPGDGGVSEVFVFNRIGTSYNTSVWNLPKNIPDGNCGLGIKKNASAWTTIEIPEDGHYRFSFRAAPRNPGESGQLGLCLSLQVGSDGEHLTTFGHFRSVVYEDAFRLYSYRLPYLRKGTYQLWFKSSGDNGDKTEIFDCMEAVREEPGDDWLLPNGNFESIAAGADTFRNFWEVTNANAAAVCDWTFEQPAAKSTSQAASIGARQVVPVTPVMYLNLGRRSTYADNCGYLCNLAEGDNTAVSLHLCDGGAASCTFTPPAGCWQLCADATTVVTHFSKGENYVNFRATLTPTGGEPIDLGTVAHDGVMLLQKDVFPTVIDADGKTEYTLRLWCEISGLGNSSTGAVDAALNLDNVRLVLPQGGFVMNGGFEGGGWGAWTVTGFSTNQYGQLTCERLNYTYDSNRTAYGTDLPVGSYCLRLLAESTVTQPISFRTAGDYRLTALMRSRAGYGDSGWFNPARFWYAKGGVTNLICDFFTPGTTNFAHYAWNFRVTDPGDYVLGIEGGSPGVDKTTLVDEVSVVPVLLAAEAPAMNPELYVNVAEGAKLRLDYPGTATVARVSYAGAVCRGVVTAETNPEFVTGPGALEVVPLNKGMTILVR